MTKPDRADTALAQWRRERPDLVDPFPMAVLGRLNEASLVISRDRLAPLFARFGLQMGEFDVLATLRRSGAPYELTPTALYESAMISSGGMTNRLDRLEKEKLIERRPHPTDRRGSLVALTPKGFALMERAIEEQAELYRLLAKLLDGARRPGPEKT